MINNDLYLNKKYGIVDGIDIDNLIKLKDEYFKVIYKDKLFAGGLYDEQVIISNELIYNIIVGNRLGTGEDILINITRQFGKSFVVYALVGFVLIFMPKILGIEGYTIGIVTNKKDQAKKNYEEVRSYIVKTCSKFSISIDESTKNTLRLGNGSKIVLFSMEAENNEGETLHWIIDDEAQALDFEKFSTQIIPMGLRTGAITTYIGVGGFKRNGYYEKLQDKNAKLFQLDYNDCVAVCEKRYEVTKDKRHLLYKEGIQKQIQSNELTETAFKTQYLLEWVLERGNFITRERLEQMRGARVESIQTQEICYAGIDFGKKNDRTVLTIVSIIDGKIKVVKWVELGGDMRIQFATIKDELEKYPVAKIYCDSTGNQDSTLDFLEQYVGVGRIKRINFNLQSKHAMYTNLELILQSAKFEYLQNDNTRKFESEICDLVKEYKGNYMTCHHPDEANGHDDYPDSLALACYFKIEFKSYNNMFM